MHHHAPQQRGKRVISLAGQVLAGRISRAPSKIATAIAPVIPASQVPAQANAAVAAQVIDENASANVATRDEICRRRNWLRFACARNQSWIWVADAEATAIPMAE